MTDLANVSIEVSAKITDLGDVNAAVKSVGELRGAFSSATNNIDVMDRRMRAYARNIENIQKVLQLMLRTYNDSGQSLSGFEKQFTGTRLKQLSDFVQSFVRHQNVTISGLRTGAEVLERVTTTGTKRLNDAARDVRNTLQNLDKIGGLGEFMDKLTGAKSIAPQVAAQIRQSISTQLASVSKSTDGNAISSAFKASETLKKVNEDLKSIRDSYRHASEGYRTLQSMDRIGVLPSGNYLSVAKEKVGELLQQYREATREVVRFKRENASSLRTAGNPRSVHTVLDIESAFGPEKDAQGNAHPRMGDRKIMQIFAQRYIGDLPSGPPLSIFVQRTVKELENLEGGFAKLNGSGFLKNLDEEVAKRIAHAVAMGDVPQPTSVIKADLRQSMVPQVIRDMKAGVLDGKSSPSGVSLPEQEALKRTLAYIGNSTLVGHNIKEYDWPEIARLLSKNGIERPRDPNMVDTLRLARLVRTGSTQSGMKAGVRSDLETLAKEMLPGFDSELAHEASYDVENTKRILDRLMVQMSEELARKSRGKPEDFLNRMRMGENPEDMWTNATRTDGIGRHVATNNLLKSNPSLTILSDSDFDSVEKGLMAVGNRLEEASGRWVQYRQAYDKAVAGTSTLTQSAISKTLKELTGIAGDSTDRQKLISDLKETQESLLAMRNELIPLKKDNIYASMLDGNYEQIISRNRKILKSATDLDKAIKEIENTKPIMKADRIKERETSLDSAIPMVQEFASNRAKIINLLKEMDTAFVSDQGLFKSVVGEVGNYYRLAKSEMSDTKGLSEETQRQMVSMVAYAEGMRAKIADAVKHNQQFLAKSTASDNSALIETLSKQVKNVEALGKLIDQSRKVINGSGGGAGGGGRGSGGGGGGGGLPPTPPTGDDPEGGRRAPRIDEMVRSYLALKDAIRKANEEAKSGSISQGTREDLETFRSSFVSSIEQFKNGWMSYRKAFENATDPSVISRVETGFTSALTSIDRARTQVTALEASIKKLSETKPISAFDAIGRGEYDQFLARSRGISSETKSLENDIRISFLSSARSVENYNDTLRATEGALRKAQENLANSKSESSSLIQRAQESGAQPDSTYYRDVERLNKSILDQQASVMSLTKFYSDLSAKKEQFQQAQSRTTSEFYKQATVINRVVGSLETLQSVLYTTGLVVIVGSVIQTAVAMDRMEAALRATFPTLQTTAREMNYLMETADRLGVSYGDLMQPYARLAASAQATGFSQNQLREVFEATITASQALGMDSENTRGIIRAFEQMMNKGKVMAEELRQQLGDRLPGAANLFARAFFIARGEITETAQVSTTQMREFEDAMKRGEVTASRVLPIVARLMSTDMADAAALMSQKILAEFNRLKNAFTTFSRELFQLGLESGFKDIVDSLESVLKGGPIRNFIDQVVIGFASMADWIEKNITMVSYLALSFGALLGISAASAALLAFVGILKTGVVIITSLAVLMSGWADSFTGLNDRIVTTTNSLIQMRATISDTGSVSIVPQLGRPNNAMENELLELEERRKRFTELRDQSINDPTGRSNMFQVGLDETNTRIRDLVEVMNNYQEVTRSTSDVTGHFSLQVHGLAIALGLISLGALISTVSAASAAFTGAATAALGFRAALVAVFSLTAGLPVLLAGVAAAIGVVFLMSGTSLTNMERSLDEATNRVRALEEANRSLTNGTYDPLKFTNAINNTNRALDASIAKAEQARVAFAEIMNNNAANNATGTPFPMRGRLDSLLSGTGVTSDQFMIAVGQREDVRARLGNRADRVSTDGEADRTDAMIRRQSARTGVSEQDIRILGEVDRLFNSIRGVNRQRAEELASFQLSYRNSLIEAGRALAVQTREMQNQVDLNEKLRGYQRTVQREATYASTMTNLNSAHDLRIINSDEFTSLSNAANSQRNTGTPMLAELASRLREVNAEVDRATNAMQLDFSEAIKDAQKAAERLNTEGLTPVQKTLMELQEMMNGRERNVGITENLRVAEQGLEYAERSLTQNMARRALLGELNDEVTGADRVAIQQADAAVSRSEGLIASLTRQANDARGVLAAVNWQLLQIREGVAGSVNRISSEQGARNTSYNAESDAMGRGDTREINRIQDERAALQAATRAREEFVKLLDTEEMWIQYGSEAARLYNEAFNAEMNRRVSQRRQPFATAINNANDEISEVERMAAAYSRGADAVEQTTAAIQAQKTARTAEIEDASALTTVLERLARAKREEAASRQIFEVRQSTNLLRTPEGIDRDVAKFAQDNNLQGPNARVGEYRTQLTEQRTQELSNQNDTLSANIRLEQQKAAALLGGAEAVSRAENLEKLLTEARKLAGAAAAEHILQNGGITSSLQGVTGVTEGAFNALMQYQNLLNNFSGAKFMAEVNGIIRTGFDDLIAAGAQGAGRVLALNGAGRTQRPLTPTEEQGLRLTEAGRVALADLEAAMQRSKGRLNRNAPEVLRFNTAVENSARVNGRGVDSEGQPIPFGPGEVAGLNSATFDRLQANARRSAASQGGGSGANNAEERFRLIIRGWDDSRNAAEGYYDAVEMGGERLDENQSRTLTNLRLMADAVRNFQRRDSALESAMRSAGLGGADQDTRAINGLIAEMRRYELAVNNSADALERLRLAGQENTTEYRAAERQTAIRRERLASASRQFEDRVNDPNNPRTRRIEEVQSRTRFTRAETEADSWSRLGFGRQGEIMKEAANIRRERERVDLEERQRVSQLQRTEEETRRAIANRQSENTTLSSRLSGDGVSSEDRNKITADMQANAREIERLSEVMRLNSAEADTMKESYSALRDQLGMRETFNSMRTEFEIVGEVINEITSSTSRMFAEMLTTGKGTFKGLAMSFVQDLLTKIINELIIKRAMMLALKFLMSSLGFTFGDGGVISGGKSLSVPSTPAGESDGMFAKGGVFSGGRVKAFAGGGIVSSPTFFPMAGNATGLMGEAGPEAIMPLRRLGNGRLGVEAHNPGFAGGPISQGLASRMDDTSNIDGIEASSLMVNAGSVMINGRSSLQDWMGTTPDEVASSNAQAVAAKNQENTGPTISVTVTVNLQGSPGTPEQNEELGKAIGKQVGEQFRAMYAEETRRQMKSGGMFNQ